MSSLQLLKLVTIPCSWNAANWFLLNSPTKLLIQTPRWAQPYGHKCALPAFFQQVAKTNLKNSLYSRFCLLHLFYTITNQLLTHNFKTKDSKTQRFSLIHLAAKPAPKRLKVINSLNATYLLWVFVCFTVEILMSRLFPRPPWILCNVFYMHHITFPEISNKILNLKKMLCQQILGVGNLYLPYTSSS